MLHFIRTVVLGQFWNGQGYEPSGVPFRQRVSFWWTYNVGYLWHHVIRGREFVIPPARIVDKKNGR